ncbi:unnamed protein product, partial [Ixodes pacificus]
VCALHFHDSFIVRKSIYRDPRNGKTIETALPVPRLDPAAVPSIFKERPSYLSKPECTKAREEPQQRLERLESSQLVQAVADSLISYTEETSKNQFQTLKELNACLKSAQVPEKWSVLHTASSVMFLLITGGGTSTLDASVVIEDSLDVTVCHNKVRLTKIDEYQIPTKVQDVRCLLEILDKLSHFEADSAVPKDVLAAIHSLLNVLKKQLPMESRSMLKAIQEQLELITMKSPRYSPHLMVVASLLLTISHHAYKFLRHAGTVTLPRPATIRKLCSS